MGSAGPAWTQLGATGDHQQKPERFGAIDQAIDQLQRAGVGPLSVLEHDQHGPLARQILDLPDQRLQHELLAPLRRQLGLRIARVGRQRQQRRQVRQTLATARDGDDGLETFEATRGWVTGQASRGERQPVDGGAEGTGLLMWRGLQPHQVMRLGAHRVFQRRQQPRLAQARLGDQQDHLAIAAARGGPAILQEAELPFPSGQRGQPGPAAGLETALGVARALDHEGGDRRGKPLERVRSQRLDVEAPVQQIAGGLRDDNPARGRQRLQPRREIGRLAHHGPLLGGTLADQVSHHREAGGEPEAHLGPEVDAGLDDAQRRAHAPLGVVLVRARVAEVHEDPVAHVAGDEAIEAGDLGRGALLEGAHQVAQNPRGRRASTATSSRQGRRT